MNPIQLAIEQGVKEFDEKYRSFELCEQVTIEDRERLITFLLSSASQIRSAALSEAREIEEQEASKCEEHCRIAYEKGKKGEPLYFEEVVKEAALKDQPITPNQ